MLKLERKTRATRKRSLTIKAIILMKYSIPHHHRSSLQSHPRLKTQHLSTTNQTPKACKRSHQKQGKPKKYLIDSVAILKRAVSAYDLLIRLEGLLILQGARRPVSRGKGAVKVPLAIPLKPWRRSSTLSGEDIRLFLARQRIPAEKNLLHNGYCCTITPLNLDYKDYSEKSASVFLLTYVFCSP